MLTVRDLLGSDDGKLGLWVVLYDNGISRKLSGRSRHYWMCRCRCGNTKLVLQEHLKSGRSSGCGCTRIAAMQRSVTKHGMCFSCEYRSWAHAKGRCFVKTDQDYDDYGGRGITMCSEWRDSFESFYKSMGDCPDGMSLDRINVNGNYEPGNCRWATPKQQQRNRRNNHLLTHNNETLPVSVWAERLGIDDNVILERVKRGCENVFFAGDLRFSARG